MRMFKLNAQVKFTHPTIKDERHEVIGTVTSERYPHTNGSGYYMVDFAGKVSSCWEEDIFEALPDTIMAQPNIDKAPEPTPDNVGDTASTAATKESVTPVTFHPTATEVYTFTIAKRSPASLTKIGNVIDAQIGSLVKALQDKGVDIVFTKESK